MSNCPPPNEALAELASVLGDDNVRTLVRTFLRDFPLSFQELNGGDRHNRHRIAHSMKSNARLMGAHELSQCMAAIEDRLAQPGGQDITAADLAAIDGLFRKIAAPLRDFVGN
jgi:HPt (histidine-containing phosphotransfer) domain-containing protein